MNLWQRIHQVVRLAWHTWQLREPSAMVVGYDTRERSLLFADGTTNEMIEGMMRMIYSEGDFQRPGRHDDRQHA